jgi:hypothetical protein
MIIAEYIKRLYDRSLLEKANQDLKRRQKEMASKEEEFDMNKRIADDLLTKNALMQKELDVSQAKKTS